MGLNQAQQQAVDHDRGPLLINATAGSGKTRAITHRAASLLRRGVEPERLLLVTFTNKAAREMKSRIAQLVGGGQASAIWAGTFHSVCMRLLRAFDEDSHREGRTKGFSVYDEDDSLGCVKGAMNELLIDPKTVKPSDVREVISRAKSDGLTPANLPPPEDDLAVMQHAIWKRYEAILRGNNAYDFDDLLNVTMRTAEGSDGVADHLRRRFTHVLVDEYQDTSEVQFRLVKALASSRNLSVVGDVNQSLYAWRGARPENILEFATKHYPDAVVVDMKTNYRSTRNIVAAANAFIVNGDADTSNVEGDRVLVRGFADEDAEARFVADGIQARLKKGTPAGECVVLYRNHVLSRAIEDQLRNRGIRYDVVGGTNFYDRKVVRDILGYLRLVVNPESNLDFERVINTPPRGLGDKAVAKIRERARERGVSMHRAVQAALAENFITGKPREGLLQFFYLLRQAHDDLGHRPPSVIAEEMLTQSGYRAFLEAKAKKLKSERKHADAEKAERDVEHINGVVAAIASYEARVEKPSLRGYIDEVALITAQDEAKGDKVLLSTIHGFKGLEADAVWVLGFEHGFLPSEKDVGAIAEEKRVAFVACSRARKWMTITYAEGRLRYGQWTPTGPSQFLDLLSESCRDWPERDMLKLQQASADTTAVALAPF